MSAAIGEGDDDDGRQAPRSLEQYQIRRQHRLRSRHSQLPRDRFDGVDRCAVNVGLASLPRAAVGQVHIESAEQRLECGRAAIHRGCLDDFGNEITALHSGLESHWPAVRKVNPMGDTCSTVTSSVPGMPCCKVPRKLEFSANANSTRTLPSRTSCATRSPRAATVPNAACAGYCATTSKCPAGIIEPRRSPSETTVPTLSIAASPTRPSTGARMR